jgi:hypothetical protein
MLNPTVELGRSQGLHYITDLFHICKIKRNIIKDKDEDVDVVANRTVTVCRVHWLLHCLWEMEIVVEIARKGRWWFVEGKLLVLISKKHRYEIRWFCVWKCNHMFVCDLFNNTVIWSAVTLKSDMMNSAIWIIRLQNKVVMA